MSRPRLLSRLTRDSGRPSSCTSCSRVFVFHSSVHESSTLSFSSLVVQASLEHEADDIAAPPTARQTHELWWDVDSGILNSRARHTIKVPGGTLDKPPDKTDENATDEAGSGTEVPGDRPLNNLLDCMFGRGDVNLLLFWSASGAGAGQRAPSNQVRGDDGELGLGEGKQERRSLGKTVLRRSDLLPLVRRASSRVVLKLPMEATRDGSAPPSPDVLPLSISYRREPLAVARRKSLVGASRRRAAVGDGEKGGGREAGGERTGQGLHGWDVSCAFEDPRGEHVRGTSPVDSPLRVSTLARADEERPIGEDRRWEGSSSPQHGAPGAPEESVAVDASAAAGGGGVGSLSTWDGESDATPVHRSPRTEHMLPARTTVCVRVDSVELATANGAAGVEASTSPEGEFVTWASFEFPGRDGFGQGGGKDGVVWVWRPGRQGGTDRDVHWSPAVSARREGGRDRVPLEWNVEVRGCLGRRFVLSVL